MSMELKIVNPTANSFNEAVGISEKRSEELGQKLNEMSKALKGKLVYTVDIFNEIAGFCNNTEELIFCTVSHCNYLAITYGQYLCPPKKSFHKGGITI